MALLSQIKKICGIIDLIYPELCPSCCMDQPVRNHFLCLKCLSDLPLTNHHRNPQHNEVAAIFWGRIPIRAAAALYYFSSSGGIRGILHRIKYEGRSDIAFKMGEIMGYYLAQSPAFKRVDAIVPVPLHPAKKAIRGFNQCDHLAIGLSERLGVNWLPGAVKRTRNNPSQTKLTRDKRIQNSQSLFKVCQPEELKGRNILLIDDLVTTGATLESCGLELLEAGVENLFIATLGCGE